MTTETHLRVTTLKVSWWNGNFVVLTQNYSGSNHDSAAYHFSPGKQGQSLLSLERISQDNISNVPSVYPVETDDRNGSFPKEMESG